MGTWSFDWRHIWRRPGKARVNKAGHNCVVAHLSLFNRRACDLGGVAPTANATLALRNEKRRRSSRFLRRGAWSLPIRANAPRGLCRGNAAGGHPQKMETVPDLVFRLKRQP